MVLFQVTQDPVVDVASETEWEYQRDSEQEPACRNEDPHGGQVEVRSRRDLCGILQLGYDQC